MKFSLFFFLLFCSFIGWGQFFQSQEKTYTEKDSLKGMLSFERACFDVKSYELSLAFDLPQKSLQGKNIMGFQMLEESDRIQLDLFENMSLDSVLFYGENLHFTRKYSTIFILFQEKLKKSKDTLYLDLYFSGQPLEGETPPWDGGMVFSKDQQVKDWVGMAVQGIGASLWFPCKDHPSDEAEEVKIHLKVPKDLKGISNGRLICRKELADATIYSWEVKNPINNYNITFYIGDYQHFSDTLEGLSLDYYVLPEHLEKAKIQFQQVPKMLTCFSEKFGSYPFFEDGYKIVDAPYLGMEHQSAIAYGNHYQNGYLGKDLSGTGIGLEWDFIIVHESGHEWFGNSITASDIADMWIQESLTTYSESVFVECYYGKEKAVAYLEGIRKRIVNQSPMRGVIGVHQEGSTDMYYKGANLIHVLRSVVNEDEKWWEILQDFVFHFHHQQISKEDFIHFFEEKINGNVRAVIDQYVEYASLPVLEYRFVKGQLLQLRWKAEVEGFNMPVELTYKGKLYRFEEVGQEWQTTNVVVRSPKKLCFNQRDFLFSKNWIGVEKE